jgi:hypothetical protein
MKTKLFNQHAAVAAGCYSLSLILNIPTIFFSLSLIPHIAIHNWNGKVKHGLALDVGDFVEIFEENGQWWRGSCTRKPRSVGLFPKGYVKLKDPSKEDQVVAECTQVLREWSEIWKKLFVVSELGSDLSSVGEIFKVFSQATDATSCDE